MSIPFEQLDQLGRFERLQLVEDLWDGFASECSAESEAAVLNELEHRAAWSRAHPEQDKTLQQVAQSLGIRL